MHIELTKYWNGNEAGTRLNLSEALAVPLVARGMAKAVKAKRVRNKAVKPEKFSSK